MLKSPPTSPAERFRLQVEMSSARVATIDTLVNLTGMSSRKEFFDNALSLMAWAIREAQKGRAIGSIDLDNPSEVREVTMPCLSHLHPIHGQKEETE